MPEIVRQRIETRLAYVGIRLEVETGVEFGTGVATLAHSIAEIMKKRIHAGASHIWIAIEIPSRIEQWVRSAAPAKAFGQIMFRRDEFVLPCDDRTP